MTQMPDRDHWSTGTGMPDEHAIVVRDTTLLEDGVALAKQRAREGQFVRLIAVGATLHAPGPRIVHTELDAYLPTDRCTPLLHARAQREAQLQSWFGPIGRALYASYCNRAPPDEALLEGLHQWHSQVEFLGEDPPASIVRGLGALAAAVTLRTGEEWETKQAKLRHGAENPSVWLAVIANAPHTCRLVIDEARKLRETEASVGILLFDKLSRDASAVAAIEDALGRPAVAIESCSQLQDLSALPAGVAASLRALKQGAAPHKLATIDILRAVEAERASEWIASRYDLRGARVYFPHASLPSVAAADLTLQKHGAVTYELVHGAFPDFWHCITYAASLSSVRVVFTELEAERMRELVPSQQTIVRPRVNPTPQKPRPIKKLLALTNYAHGYALRRGASIEAFQRAFLDALPTDKAIRWRPHPDDDPEGVRRALRPGIELSFKARSLPEDLAWADAVVSSVSTALFEAEDAGLPVLVHRVPLFEAINIARSFPSFTSASELRALLAAHDSDSSLV